MAHIDYEREIDQKSADTKTMCKYKKEKIEENLETLKQIVKNPKYICRKCARVAKEEKYLCKPLTLE
jgi:hypothetical protein